MTEEAIDADDRWRTFLRERYREVVSQLAAAYPDERSLYVDVVDLYDHDPELTSALLSNPDQLLQRAVGVLRDLHESFDRVNVRLTNHPGLLAIGSVRTRHVGELVSVEGTAEAVDQIQAAIDVAVYECPVCGGTSRVRTPTASRNEPPHCADCDTHEALLLRPERCTYVDSQRVTIVDDRPADVPRELDVYLDDDLVESVRPGDTVVATGVLRLSSTDRSNRFDFFLDANAVETAHDGRPDRDSAAADDIQELIRDRWQFVVGRERGPK